MSDHKKHLVFITNSTIAGGAEICLKNIVQELSSYPLEMRTIYPQREEIKELFKNIPGQKNNLYLGKSTIKFRGLNLFSPMMFIYYKRLKNLILKIHQNNKIDLLFCQQDPKEKILTALIGQKLKIPVIWMEHSKLHPWQYLAHYKYLYRYFSRKVNKIITVSKAVKYSLCQIGVKAEKMRVVYNGVKVEKLEDNEIQKFKKEWQLNKKIIIGSCSRLAYNKGLHELTLAAASVIKKNKNIIFLIIGSGKEEKSLKKLVQDLKLEKYIKFAGFQNNASRLNSLFDVVVSPSFDEGEGLPLRIIEAMALAKPVIATDISGSKEEIKNGVNGYLIALHQIKLLAKLILELAGHKKLRQKMGGESYKIYRKKFTLKKMGQRIYQEMRQIISNS